MATTTGLAVHRLAHIWTRPCPMQTFMHHQAGHRTHPNVPTVRHGMQHRHLALRFTTQASPSTSAQTLQTKPNATSSLKAHVVVLGAGVIGMTSAIRLLQAGACVTVVTSCMGWETTTAGAAGLWGPYKLGDTPPDLVQRWSSDTLSHLYDLLHSTDAEDAGVSLRLVHRYQEAGTPNPSWMNVTDHFTFLSDAQLNRVNRHLRLHPPFTQGWQYHSISCEGGPYLAWLHKQILHLGGNVFLTQIPVTSLSQLSDDSFWAGCTPAKPPPKRGLGSLNREQQQKGLAVMGGDSLVSLKGFTVAQYLAMDDVKQQAPGTPVSTATESGTPTQGPSTHSGTSTQGPSAHSGTSMRGAANQVDLIINCTGLGAHKLLNDMSVIPIRGQVLRVAAPWVTSAYLLADSLYVIPNTYSIVLGGTSQVGDWNTKPSTADRQRIVAGCVDMLPSLSTAVILQDWVGLRPGRTSVRLELVTGKGGSRTSKDALPHVIHNYGHGGSGLTLAWGCARDVVELAREVFL